MHNNGTYSGSSVALPTVRAENFWARPAHSRQRTTSIGQTRILSQRVNKLSKLRTVQNSLCVAWALPKHTNYLWRKSKCLKIHNSPCTKMSAVERGLLVYFTSSPWFCLPNRLCRHSPYFWQCDKPPRVPDLFPSLGVSSPFLPLFNSTSFLHTPSHHTWFCRLDPLSDAGCSPAGRER